MSASSARATRLPRRSRCFGSSEPTRWGSGDLEESEIDTLGDMMMARSGRLIVRGGFGRAGGQVPIATYTGADTWFDDIADGPVWCRLKLKGQEEPIVLTQVEGELQPLR